MGISSCNTVLMSSNALRASVRAVRGRRFIPTKKAIVLTPAAIDRIKHLAGQQEKPCSMKVGVRQRGCNGMTYTLEFCDKKAKFDEEVEQDGVKVIIDSKAQMTLLGTEMDYVGTKLASEFVFNNPNIKGTCGCGESFNM